MIIAGKDMATAGATGAAAFAYTGTADGTLAIQINANATGTPIPSSTEWRIIVDEGGHHQYLSIQEIEMSESISGANACSGGVADAGVWRTGWTPGEAFDGDKTTTGHGWSVDKDVDENKVDHWISYAFPGAVQIAEVRLFARQDDNAYHMPVSWRLQYKDGANWVTHWTVKYEDWFTHEETRTYNGDTDNSFAGARRYWRIRAADSDNGSYIHWSEIEMRTAINGSDITDSADEIHGAQRTGFEGTKAFDDIISGNNSWGVQKSVTVLADRWVGQDFTSPTTIREVAVSARDDTFEEQAPRSFVVEASTDLSDWAPVWYEEHVGPVWVAGETRTFADPNQSGLSGKNVILALMGQSNMVGRDGPIASPADDSDDDILEWTGGSFGVAAEPLDHFDENPNEIGPGLSAAKKMLEEQGARRVYLVPVAEGGTGFLNGDWNPNRNSAVYENARDRWEAAYTAFTDLHGDNNYAEVAGALWIQSEDELQNYPSLFNTASDGRYEYLTMPTSMFELMRRGDWSGWTTTTPVAFGQVPPGATLTAAGTAYTEIQAGIADVTNKMDYASHAVGTDLTTSDGTHYDAASYRTMGERLQDALLAARTATAAITTDPGSFTEDASNVETAYAFDASGQGDGAPLIMQAGTYPAFENKRVWVSGGTMIFDGTAELRWSKNASRQDRPDLDDRDFVFKMTFTTDTASGTQGLWGCYDTGTNQRSYSLRTSATALQFLGSSDGSTPVIMLEHTISAATEYDVEIRRVGTALTMHVDGILRDSYTLTGGYTFFDSASTIFAQIGDYVNNNELEGDIVRFSLEYLS